MNLYMGRLGGGKYHPVAESGQQYEPQGSGNALVRNLVLVVLN